MIFFSRREEEKKSQPIKYHLVCLSRANDVCEELYPPDQTEGREVKSSSLDSQNGRKGRRKISVLDTLQML